ncbi:hypothetical protein B6U90_04225 [Thermoplasmatales archaeon ex4484_6]|nr:MAG: hypothetical protein B6U90_04225 [Thermoplasmatales archaeon ex4484_6]
MKVDMMARKKKSRSKVGKYILIGVGVVVGLIIVGVIFSAIANSSLGDRFKDLMGKGSDGSGGGNNTESGDTVPPKAFLTADKYKAIVGDPITFDGNRSYDPGKESNITRGIMLYQWNFGYTDDDGTPIVESTVNGTTIHSFPDRGDFTVTLTVFDDAENEDSAQVTVIIVPPNEPISTGSSILIGDPVGPGIFGNSTEVTWNLTEGATYMWLNISVTGAYVREGQSTTVEIVLENPYLDVIKNQTVKVLGTEAVPWTFQPEEISVEGRYTLTIHAVDGAAIVSVMGEATYL